ncbi:MAG: hypothetical protein HC944_02845 [Nanoarchaeota archaeon]|nr:hypothetical protein [Nanoarchaeota archaeon]
MVEGRARVNYIGDSSIEKDPDAPADIAAGRIYYAVIPNSTVSVSNAPRILPYMEVYFGKPSKEKDSLVFTKK